MLRKHGYEVILASDGTEALALYVQRQAKVAAVLTDIAMPHIDGVALTRALMKLNPGIRVIASTGFGDNARMAELRSLGAAAFLSKPFTTDKLLQVVHEVLQPRGDDSSGDSMA
jgi:DNA-binding NtrC family response regulator